MNISAEALILLELIKVIEKKSRHIIDRKIIISIDCREEWKKIVKNIMKISYIISDRGEEIIAIKKLISK